MYRHTHISVLWQTKSYRKTWCVCKNLKFKKTTCRHKTFTHINSTCVNLEGKTKHQTYWIHKMPQRCKAMHCYVFSMYQSEWNFTLSHRKGKIIKTKSLLRVIGIEISYLCTGYLFANTYKLVKKKNSINLNWYQYWAHYKREKIIK